LPSNFLGVPLQNLWVAARGGRLLGVANCLESFYKPELEAAHNHPLHAIRPAPPLTVLKYPDLGITDNWDFLI
jgi:hypothetical protein